MFFSCSQIESGCALPSNTGKRLQQHVFQLEKKRTCEEKLLDLGMEVNLGKLFTPRLRLHAGTIMLPCLWLPFVAWCCFVFAWAKHSRGFASHSTCPAVSNRDLPTTIIRHILLIMNHNLDLDWRQYFNKRMHLILQTTY